MIHVLQVVQMPQIQSQYIFAQNAKKEFMKAVDIFHDGGRSA